MRSYHNEQKRRLTFIAETFEAINLININLNCMLRLMSCLVGGYYAAVIILTVTTCKSSPPSTILKSRKLVASARHGPKKPLYTFRTVM